MNLACLGCAKTVSMVRKLIKKFHIIDVIMVIPKEYKKRRSLRPPDLNRFGFVIRSLNPPTKLKDLAQKSRKVINKCPLHIQKGSVTR